MLRLDVRIVEIVRDLLLVAFGYLAAEFSAFLKWRRDRRDLVADREYEKRRSEERERERLRAEQLEACVALLSATHHVAIGGLLEGWSEAYQTAMESLNRVRLTLPPQLAMDASRLYVAATSPSGRGDAYQTALAHLVNRLREHFGQDIIQQLEEYLDEPYTGS